MKFKVIHQQEILVDFYGFVEADSPEEAIEKVENQDVEFSGEYKIADNDYVGPWDKWTIFDDQDNVIYEDEE